MYKMNQNVLNKLIIGLSAIVIAVVTSACKQSNASSIEKNIASQNATTLVKPISDNMLKMVNATFYQTFILGDWRYKGARNLGGTINAYIQIPQPLEMSREVQKSYLRHAICPSANHVKMWSEIDGIPLSIHIYTYGQKHSLYVDCQNPFTAG